MKALLGDPEKFAEHIASTLLKRLDTTTLARMDLRRVEEREDGDPDGDVIRSHYDLEFNSGRVRVSMSESNNDDWYYAVSMTRDGVEFARAGFDDDGEVGQRLFERIEQLVDQQKEQWAQDLSAEIDAI